MKSEFIHLLSLHGDNGWRLLCRSYSVLPADSADARTGRRIPLRSGLSTRGHSVR